MYTSNLPGVFADNPHPSIVNGQLWTVPWELRCYMLLAAIAFFGVFRNLFMLVSSIAVICVVALAHDLIYPPDVWVSVHGIILVEAFIVG